MIIYVDLDNTLCLTDGEDYQNAVPMFERIKKINELNADNTVVIYTARGSGSGKNHRALTEKQLAQWGVKYHKLSIAEKPVFDLLIDDKTVHPNIYFNNE